MMSITSVKNWDPIIIKQNFFLRNRKREEGIGARIVQTPGHRSFKGFAWGRPDKLRRPIKNTRCFQRNYQAARDWRLNNNASKFTQFKKPKDKTNITGYPTHQPTSLPTITPITCTNNTYPEINRGKRGAKNKSRLLRKTKRKKIGSRGLVLSISTGNGVGRTSAITRHLSYYRSLNKNIVIIS